MTETPTIDLHGCAFLKHNFLIFRHQLCTFNNLEKDMDVDRNREAEDKRL